MRPFITALLLSAALLLAPSTRRPEYPQPQFQRAQWMNLNGTWEFEYDDSNLGLDQNWATPAFPRIPLGKSGLHAANVMPIWLLASTVWKRPLPAFFTAAIFAVHPVVRIGYQYCRRAGLMAGMGNTRPNIKYS